MRVTKINLTRRTNSSKLYDIKNIGSCLRSGVFIQYFIMRFR